MNIEVPHFVVGKTRSEKIVRCATEELRAFLIPNHFKRCSFTDDDFLDAYAIFEYLSIRSKRKNDLNAPLYEEHSFEIRKAITGEIFEVVKLRAGIVTVFDLCCLGQSLASIEFKDL